MRPKYLIKYAAMPIHSGNKIAAYIASKCYLTGEHKIYLNENETITTYDVVYMYSPTKKRLFPDFEYGKYVNSVNVDKVFDSVVQCKNYVREQNNAILYKSFVGLSYDEMIYQYNHKEEIFKKYYDLETELLCDIRIVDFEKENKKRKLGIKLY